jgi:uncharacterized protein
MGICRAIIVLCLLGTAAQAECRADSLEMRGQSGVARFNIEVADDNDERAQGLMFRESMPSSSGMLFIYPTPRRASFWMENTLIPLDMIFADATGTVTHIHENAIPKDRTSIDGGENVKFVFEINAGLARRLGLTEGATLRHPAVDQSIAAFPCLEE